MAKRTRGDGGTPATVAFAAAGIAFTARTYAHDPAAASYGLEAAEALGVEPARVLKTLLVEAETGLAVDIVPVHRQLDLKAIAAALGVKRVQMADPRAAERVTGYVVGGISPIGQSAGCQRSSTTPPGMRDRPGLRRSPRARHRAEPGRPDRRDRRGPRADRPLNIGSWWMAPEFPGCASPGHRIPGVVQ